MNEEVERQLQIPQYDIEIWHAKTNKYVADISNILVDGLQIDWVLNDVESISFTLDLVQFEKKCEAMGVAPADVITPYVHDVRIRRNGEYIVGGQIVEQVFNITPESAPTMEVKCTGFLNLFKDQYIDAQWSGYTYSELAKKLVLEAQQPDNLALNGSFDIDTSSWLPVNGAIARLTDTPHSGDGYLNAINSTAGTWISAGTQIKCPAGSIIKVSGWAIWQSGTSFNIVERKFATISSNQATIGSDSAPSSSWKHFEFTYVTLYDDPYILFEYQQKSGTTSSLKLDDININFVGDDVLYRDLGVNLGIDTATENQQNDRQRKYELQNVKDAIMELTCLENDNFDFDFSADRTFNVYQRKGDFVLDVEAVYPGNVDTMTITRSASNLANKVIAIGSGIGSERLQVDLYNHESQLIYGTRETLATNNNVSLKDTLIKQAIGTLYDSKDPVNLPSIVIRDGSINPSNVRVGDIILVKVDNDSYLDTINNYYRIARYNLDVDLENAETVSLTLEPQVVRPEVKRIRYIKDTINGSSQNDYNHWVEIEALRMVGNSYENVALNKTATIYGTGGSNAQKATNGNTNASDYASCTSRPASIVVDLGEEMDVDYIRVWHHYADGRRYKGNTLSVGNTLKTGNTPLDTILWQYPTNDLAYVETEYGRTSRWIQGDADGSI